MVTHIDVVKLLQKVSGYNEGTLCSICKVDFCFEKSFEFLHSSLKRSAGDEVEEEGHLPRCKELLSL